MADDLDTILRNALQQRDLSFREFVELALYHPESGYYSRLVNPVGKDADYITGPLLSPVFSFGVARLLREVLDRCGDEVSTFVDIGCGDGALLESVCSAFGRQVPDALRFYGVDRSLSRIRDSALANRNLHFVPALEQVPAAGAELLFSNELFDAFPFARLVQRGPDLHELFVKLADEELDWSENPAPQSYIDYLASHQVQLEDGQFADLSLDWGSAYAAMARRLRSGLIVTFDYGFPTPQLFHRRVRRFGTAAAYRHHRVSRDLLSSPGEQDLTAHINFDDLIAAGEAEGLETLFFDRQAKFLLALGVTDHPLFAPLEESSPATLAEGVDLLQQRENARRLVLPDGMGEDIRVLVQGRECGSRNWTFHRKLY